MKKTFATFLAIATIVALAVPAAAKGGKPGEPTHGGTTCAERDSATAAKSAGDITGLTLEGKSAEACVDVSDVQPGAWDVDVTVEAGTLRSLLVVLRDSVAPGDACGAPIHYQDNTAAPATLTFTLAGADGDYVNACGVEWAEWAPHPITDVITYYDTVEDGVESPLALLVFSQGSRDLEITLNADLPQVPSS